jgi:hypothetical protein
VGVLVVGPALGLCDAGELELTGVAEPEPFEPHAARTAGRATSATRQAATDRWRARDMVF